MALAAAHSVRGGRLDHKRFEQESLIVEELFPVLALPPSVTRIEKLRVMFEHVGGNNPNLIVDAPTCWLKRKPENEWRGKQLGVVL